MAVNSSNCDHNCETCGANCASRTAGQSFEAPLCKYAKVNKVVAVVSGKGGVGKSLVTSMLASQTQRSGKRTAVLDADITGPSMTSVFGIHQKAVATAEGLIYPALTSTGIQVLSLNMLLENDSDPVVWRGPVIAGAVKQFWTDVIWEDVDCMYVDMPPGTGDVPLTVFQSLPVDGIVVVTSPQEMVSKIVAKAVKMAGLMKIPVLGVVENMSYFQCPDCGKQHKIFGESHVEELAEKFGIKTVCKLPIDPRIAKMCDEGKIEDLKEPWLDEMVKKILG